MAALVLVGRILFAFIFITSGVNHLRNSAAMAGYAGAKGLPYPRAGVLGSGVLLLAGGLMVLLGVWGDLGALFLAAFLVPTALIMHAYWREADPGARMGDRIHFVKDIALAGASLMILALFAHAGSHLGLTLTGPLFHLR